MLMIPFPISIAEFLIFFLAVKQWGFLNTLGLYLLPCLLGFVIVSTVGRMAMMTLQGSVVRGELPTKKILHSGAIFFAGILLLIPSFTTRLIGIVLLIPGLRHAVVWRFKNYLSRKIAAGSNGFGFGRAGGMGGPFGFGGGTGGFKYYEFRNDGTGFRRTDQNSPQERDVSEANVLDVTPLKVTHEEKKNEE